METRKFFIFFALVLSINFALAYETEVNLETLPDHEVQFSFLDYSSPDELIILEAAKTYSDENGKAKVIFISEKEGFDLIVLVKVIDGGLIASGKFRDDDGGKFKSGEPVFIQVDSSGAEVLDTPKNYVQKSLDLDFDTGNDTNEAENTTQTATLVASNTTSNSTKKEVSEGNPNILGLAVFSEGKEMVTKTIPYVLGGIVLIALFTGGVLLSKNFKRLRVPREIRITKLSEISGRSIKEEIADAEERIKEAEEDLKDAKKRQLEDAKRRVVDDQNELIKLRSSSKSVDKK